MENKHYNQSLKSLLSGSINRNELRDIERASLDDDFLFEALEGINQLETSDKSAISTLEKKITETAIIRKLSPKRWMIGVAASLLLLSAVFYLLPKNTPSNLSDTEIAQSLTPQTSSPTSLEETDNTTLDAGNKKSLEKNQPQEKLQASESSPRTQEPTTAKNENKVSVEEEMTPAEPIVEAEDNIDPSTISKPSVEGRSLNASKSSLNKTKKQPEKLSDQLQVSPSTTTMNLRTENPTADKKDLINLENLGNIASRSMEAMISKNYASIKNAPSLDPPFSVSLSCDNKGVIQKIELIEGCRECFDLIKPTLMGQKLVGLSASQFEKNLRFDLKSK